MALLILVEMIGWSGLAWGFGSFFGLIALTAIFDA